MSYDNTNRGQIWGNDKKQYEESLVRDAQRWRSLVALTCNGHVDLWVFSPVEQLMIRVQEDMNLREELFDKLFNENVKADLNEEKQ